MKFRHAVRFIDDECNLNDGGEFGKSFQQIYPPDLELKCEHHGVRTIFLDLEINILNKCQILVEIFLHMFFMVLSSPSF